RGLVLHVMKERAAIFADGALKLLPIARSLPFLFLAGGLFARRLLARRLRFAPRLLGRLLGAKRFEALRFGLLRDPLLLGPLELGEALARRGDIDLLAMARGLMEDARGPANDPFNPIPLPVNREDEAPVLNGFCERDASVFRRALRRVAEPEHLALKDRSVNIDLEPHDPLVAYPLVHQLRDPGRAHARGRKERQESREADQDERRELVLRVVGHR